MPDDVVIDGRTATVTPFNGDRQLRAALSCWLMDGADILNRCRVEGNDRTYYRACLAEFAMSALIDFDRYRGVTADKLEYAALRRWVEQEIEGRP